MSDPYFHSSVFLHQSGKARPYSCHLRHSRHDSTFQTTYALATEVAHNKRYVHKTSLGSSDLRTPRSSSQLTGKAGQASTQDCQIRLGNEWQLNKFLDIEFYVVNNFPKKFSAIHQLHSVLWWKKLDFIECQSFLSLSFMALNFIRNICIQYYSHCCVKYRKNNIRKCVFWLTVSGHNPS